MNEDLLKQILGTKGLPDRLKASLALAALDGSLDQLSDVRTHLARIHPCGVHVEMVESDLGLAKAKLVQANQAFKEYLANPPREAEFSMATDAVEPDGEMYEGSAAAKELEESQKQEPTAESRSQILRS